ncbi:MAG TPA: response regulator transcription factor [Vicinamibacterales bacterium]|nr:response regulator transcription factor [Vicinamibacterales bacterium]
MSRPRILLADDHSSILDRVVRLVADEFDVVGAVGDGQAALDAAALLHPDVVVFDISMPVMSGLEAAARLGESARPPRIVFLTVHDDQAFIDAARDAGAQAYVIKNHIGTDLMPAIRGVLEGRSQFPQPAVQSSGARVRG